MRRYGWAPLVVFAIIAAPLACTSSSPKVSPRSTTSSSIFIEPLSHARFGAVPEHRLVPPTTTTTQPAPPPCDYHCDADWPIWHAIGVCEQPGRGPDGIDWTGGLPGYPGGLGIAKSTWDAFRRVAGVTVTLGSNATPEEQMRVARADRDRYHGYSGWTSVPGCTGPLPRSS